MGLGQSIPSLIVATNNKHWTNLLTGLVLSAAALFFLETNFAGTPALKFAWLGVSAMLIALAWGPICRGRLAGTFSPWRFGLVVAAGPVVIAVGLLAQAYLDMQCTLTL